MWFNTQQTQSSVPRMPIHDDDEESDEEGEAEVDPGPPTPEPGPPVEQVAEDRESESYDEPSSASHTSNTVKEDADEPLTSPEPVTPQLRPSSPSGLMISAPPTSDRAPPAQPPSPVYPMRLSVATPNQFDRSPSTMEFPWEENRIAPTESAPKQGETTWERIKGAFFTRSTSSNGRRSRTNSIGARERRYNTESSVSRESGASLTNGKVEKRDSSGPFAHQQNQPPLMQTPSASASILSLTPAISPGGASPIPLASAADLTRYADSKLAPFPGMKQLEEQRRAKALLSASSPDIVLATNSIEATQSTGSSSSATTRSPDTQRERKLSHQMSDSRIFAKFSPPVLSTTPSGASHTDYFSVPQTANSTPPASASSSLKLPMNREGVKRWLTAKKLFSSQSSSSQSPPIALVSPVIADPRPRQPTKKSSFSDLLKSRKESEPVWDDLEEDKSRTPTSAPSPGQVGKFIFKEDMKQTEVRVDIEHIVHDENHPPSTPPKQTNGCPPNNPPTLDFISFSPVFSSFPSPPDPPSSVTPDPQSSLDEFPTRSTSDSYSSTSSSRHSPHTHTPNPVPSKLGLVMERLDEILGRGSKSSLWVQPIDDPPRKLLLSSPVLQVANANTVKDRFLFLFTDIMIIAKPIMYENDALLESAKPNPSDRKFIVKSVVMLRDLRVSGERDESRVKLSSHTSSARHPCITSFVRQFAKDPDRAVTELFAKANSKNDPVALGQLIQRSIDLDRVRVGEYLTRRSSKSTLKAYVDAFEFVGLRIDKALRAFLLSVWVPPTPGALEHLLDSFAGRWYEANAGIVAFDKDQAIRLVRAILQLNEVLHGGVSQTPGMTPYPRRNVLSKDFIEAFKRPDPRCLVPEDLLDKVYIAIRREHLSHARNTSTSNSTPDIVITVKRPIPPRLTYRLQSEPVVFRIPHPDPLLTIQLFGQDLVFEPSVLNFAKSAEASFRVTGTSLGPKTIIMWRSGPSALLYSGLPLSSPVVVERSFMRYTFQLAFPNQHGAKRKYMFSADDSVIRHQWVENIKHQIDIVSAGHVGPKMINNTPESSKAYEAAEVVAFKVLQDTLIQPHDDHDISQDAVNHALARLTNGANGVANGHLGIPENTPRRRRVSSHGRSKSRSQVYQRTGAGKMEPEPDCDDGEESSPVPEDSSGPHSRSDVKMWSVRELSVICRQNSSIAPVLAYFGAAGTDSNAVTS